LTNKWDSPKKHNDFSEHHQEVKTKKTKLDEHKFHTGGCRVCNPASNKQCIQASKICQKSNELFVCLPGLVGWLGFNGAFNTI